MPSRNPVRRSTAATFAAVTGRPARSATATAVLFAAASCAFTRSEFSDRDEYCETTIAVETAATTANAAPSHHRTPMKRFVTTYRLRRERPQGAHRFRKPAGVRVRTGAADDDLEVVD